LARLVAFRQFIFFGFTLILLVYVCCIGIRNIFRYNRFKIDYEVSVQALNNQLRLNSDYKQKLAATSQNEFWALEAKQQLGLVNKYEITYQLITNNRRKN